MRIKLLILTFLFLFFGVRSAFAAISFTISNPQYNNSEITIDVSLLGLTSASCLNGSCYLQAAFTASELTRYFGFTKNHNGVWYEYIGSPESSYILATFFAFQPVDGAWSGQISLKNNSNDPDYKGPGTYNVKVWRYTGKSNSYSGTSNILTVNIEDSVPTPTPTPLPATSLTPSPTSKPSSSPTPTSAPKKATPSTTSPISSPSPSPTLKISPSSTQQGKSILFKATSAPKVSYPIATVAAVTSSATPSSQIAIKNQKQINAAVWVGLILVFAGASSLGYIYLKRK